VELPQMPSVQAVEDMLTGTVNAGELAGAATVVWRGGRVVQSAAVGWRDVEAALPIERDTIFRIASMSKPITSVVAMTLLEEGRFALDDPITRWAPEFADMRVLRDPKGPLDATDPAIRPITFEDLLTHRAGLTYADFARGPLARAYADALGADIDSHVAPDDWIAGLAELPLIGQPGAAFNYSHATDLIGLLLARMDDRPLGEVMRRRLFEPLGMTDTGFIVPSAQRHRRAKVYGFDDGRLTARPTGAAGAFVAERPDDMAFESGGQGLWSTVDDFLAFARLFVGEGAVGGVRILKPETMALVTANRLSDAQRAGARMFGTSLFAGHGFGLGVAVVMDPNKSASTLCNGAAGTVGWPGAFGGWWQADPAENSVMVFLAHNSFEPAQLAMGYGLGVYSAITQFHSMTRHACT
jgi:CubicO group peptidase (beta-lactamase class C family)